MRKEKNKIKKDLKLKGLREISKLKSENNNNKEKKKKKNKREKSKIKNN